VSVSARIHAGRRIVAIEADGQVRGSSTCRFALRLPATARRWTRVRVLVRFGGSAAVAPGAGALTVVRAR
jgi:hypothetical protein